MSRRRAAPRKVSGLKVNRNYHLLSDLEFAYFVVLEFSEDVVDIREQYPLLPTSDLQQIAHVRSIRYPKFAGTDLPYVLTTDFLVTYKASNGTTQLAARTVKYSDALQPSKSLERTLQKLEIERCFWMEQGVDWGIVTEQAIPAALSENLQWLRQGAVVDKGLLQPGTRQRFLDALDRLNPADRILSANIRIAGQAAHLHYKDAIQLFKHMVWHKIILLDLKSAPLRLTGVVPEFRFTSLDTSFERVAA
ncbi:TnsA endonuclease N-terminal domain-containing protein (plasmid) [Polaromonas sp. P1-6]|nr:TnsA endonuclease N-terminal domain-containing protein [Polaromonas sp. P1-6]